MTKRIRVYKCRDGLNQGWYCSVPWQQYPSYWMTWGIAMAVAEDAIRVRREEIHR